MKFLPVFSTCALIGLYCPPRFHRTDDPKIASEKIDVVLNTPPCIIIYKFDSQELCKNLTSIFWCVFPENWIFNVVHDRIFAGWAILRIGL